MYDRISIQDDSMSCEMDKISFWSDDSPFPAGHSTQYNFFVSRIQLFEV
jgi:hypothetical protein